MFMATTNKVFVQIDNEVIELKGIEKETFLEQLKKDNEQAEALKAEVNAQKELKLSAYKKLGLTDEEIAAII